MTTDETGETAWLREQFTGMLASGTRGELTAYVLEHPVLLSAAALHAVRLATPQDPEMSAAFTFLDGVRNHLSDHPEEYPVGYGPLERVIGALRSGEIDLQEAIDRAKTPDCSGQLSHTYVRAVMTHLEAETDGDLTFALGAAETALEAALAMPWPMLALDVRRAAAAGFIRLVHRGLVRRPDGRLYARALELGEWGVRDAEERGILPLEGAYLHWLGTLSLDAYAANFGPSPDFPAQLQVWLAKAIDPMPDVAEGLARARAYLSAAVDFRPPGRERGHTLKALVETLVYEGYARGTGCDAAEVSVLADRALGDLDPVADEGFIERVTLLRGLAEET
jgi:hypothetical protein